MEVQTKLNKELFRERFGEAWWPYIEPIFETDIMDNIFSELKEIGKNKIICPASKDTFNSYKVTNPKTLKVVIVAYDPYPAVKNKVIISNGIAFDCSNTGILQPSLEKWYEGIENELSDGLELNIVKDPSLKFFYNQGVMFSNTALSCEVGKTGSHTDLWKPYIQWVYENVLDKFTGLIYILIGKESSKVERWINPLANYIFHLEHPSFAARQYRAWETKGIFKQVNYILRNNNGVESQINWLNLGESGEPPF